MRARFTGTKVKKWDQTGHKTALPPPPAWRHQTSRDVSRSNQERRHASGSNTRPIPDVTRRNGVQEAGAAWWVACVFYLVMTSPSGCEKTQCEVVARLNMIMTSQASRDLRSWTLAHGEGDWELPFTPGMSRDTLCGTKLSRRERDEFSRGYIQ